VHKVYELLGKYCIIKISEKTQVFNKNINKFMKKFLFTLVILVFFSMPITGLLQTADPYVEKQWYLEKINAFEAWDYTKGSEEVIVAVLDTGVDITHPDLSGNIWVNMDEFAGDGIDNDNNGYIDDINGWDFIYDWPDPVPDLDWYFDDIIHHGTFVSGIIAAMENNIGVVGIANKVKIMPLKVLDEMGDGDSDTVAKAIEYAIDNGADVINLSLAGYDDTTAAVQAINKAKEANVIIVAAAGNGWFGEGFDLDDLRMYPVCYDKDGAEVLVIGVASTDVDDYPSVFSNYGEGCIDIAAPGEDMFSTKIHQLAESEEEYYGNDTQGTSFSSAIVSGSIALMRSINRSLTVEEIIETLALGADPIELDPWMEVGDMGPGRLNIYESLKNIILKHGKSASRFAQKILVSQAGDGIASFRILNQELEPDDEIFVFENEFADGLVVEVLDINNDGNLEYAVVPAEGSPVMLRILSLDQKILASNYIFNTAYTGGSDLGSIIKEDGTQELLVCTGPGRQTEVLFFNERIIKINSFIPFNDNNGCNISSGDIDNNGIDEIIVSSLSNNEVKIFNQKGELISSFVAYSSGDFKGVNIDVADINHDGFAEIITGPIAGKPIVKIFDQKGQANVSFLAYSENFTGNVKVMATDLLKNNNLDIAVVPGEDNKPHLRIFDILGNVITEKFVYSPDFMGGLNIASWQ